MRREILFNQLFGRLKEARKFLQVLAGPRQVGKTTLARQVADALDRPYHYASADEPSLKDRTWLQQQWELGRLKAKDSVNGAVLILDEIQKIPQWSSVVKFLWDSDTHSGIQLKVVLLGSAPLLIQSGLTESLAGRFEVLTIPHWSYLEMKGAFGWDVEKFIYYGGYPGAAGLIGEPDRWRQYIVHSLIETTISLDVLLMTRVDKPALLRRVFHLGSLYSGQILSYQKILGQLLDAGNTTTVAHYLELLGNAGMVIGLQKFSGKEVRQKGSSPKLQVLNTALFTALQSKSIEELRGDSEHWGRLVETAVGAHLLNGTAGTEIKISYWRERSLEVDFVMSRGDESVAFEVKSGCRKEFHPGLAEFAARFAPKRQMVIGPQGLALEEFFSTPPANWLK